MPPPAPSSTAPPADPLYAWERALLDRQLEGLARLADMGLALAEAITRDAAREDRELTPAERSHAAIMDFARASRAVRLSYALQSRLVAEFKGRPAPAVHDNDDDEDDGGEPDDASLRLSDPRKRRRHAILKAASILAHGSAVDGPEIERLEREAGERLEREEREGRFWSLSIGEMVALICHDLGIDPDWGLLESEPWVRDEVRKGPRPGSPLAAWIAARQASGEARAPPFAAAEPSPSG